MFEQINKGYIKGDSGCLYEFGRVRHGAEFPDMPAIFYFFTDYNDEPIYIECTESLKVRMSELSGKYKDVDFTIHIRFHVREFAVISKLIVEDLIEFHNPICKEFGSFEKFLDVLRQK